MRKGCEEKPYMCVSGKAFGEKSEMWRVANVTDRIQSVLASIKMLFTESTKCRTRQNKSV